MHVLGPLSWSFQSIGGNLSSGLHYCTVTKVAPPYVEVSVLEEFASQIFAARTLDAKVASLGSVKCYAGIERLEVTLLSRPPANA